jgi:hypothetical protein
MGADTIDWCDSHHFRLDGKALWPTTYAKTHLKFPLPILKKLDTKKGFIN